MACEININEGFKKTIQDIAVVNYGDKNALSSIMDKKSIDRFGVIKGTIDDNIANDFFNSRGTIHKSNVISVGDSVLLTEALSSTKSKNVNSKKAYGKFILTNNIEHSTPVSDNFKIAAIHPLLHSMIGNPMRTIVSMGNIESNTSYSIKAPIYERNSVVEFGKDYYNTIRIFGNPNQIVSSHQFNQNDITQDNILKYLSHTIANITEDNMAQWLKPYPTVREDINKLLDANEKILKQILPKEITLHIDRANIDSDATIVNTPFFVGYKDKKVMLSFVGQLKDNGIPIQYIKIPFGTYVSFLYNNNKVEFIAQDNLAFGNSPYFTFKNKPSDIAVLDYLSALTNNKNLIKDNITKLQITGINKLDILNKENASTILLEGNSPKIFFLSGDELKETPSWNSIPVVLSNDIKEINESSFNDYESFSIAITMAYNTYSTVKVISSDGVKFYSKTPIKMLSDVEFKDLLDNNVHIAALKKKIVEKIASVLHDNIIDADISDLTTKINNIDLMKHVVRGSEVKVDITKNGSEIISIIDLIKNGNINIGLLDITNKRQLKGNKVITNINEFLTIKNNC